MEKQLPARQEIRYATTDLQSAVYNIDKMTKSDDYQDMFAAVIELLGMAADLQRMVIQGGTWVEHRKARMHGYN